ncbi:MAG: hypothetical protein JSR85_06370 [Proteobacteria bacterium]|nr:hypothetical protein [Pseudomonadota bacterium]
MLKFEIIELQENNIETKLMERRQENDVGGQSYIACEEPKNTIFVIADEKRKELVGGASLFKKELSLIQEDVRELVTTLPLQNRVWECSNVYIETFYKNLEPEKKDFVEFSQSFYRGFYEGLVEFGKQKKAGFVIMKLSSDIYNATKKFGLWPYVVELKPENSPDGLFHGILPLTGSQYKAYQKRWDN